MVERLRQIFRNIPTGAKLGFTSHPVGPTAARASTMFWPRARRRSGDHHVSAAGVTGDLNVRNSARGPSRHRTPIVSFGIRSAAKSRPATARLWRSLSWSGSNRTRPSGHRRSACPPKEAKGTKRAHRTPQVSSSSKTAGKPTTAGGRASCRIEELEN